MGKIASETAELLKEIILSCSAEDILPEELDNFIDFLANVSDSNANEPQAIDKTGAEVLFLTSFLTEELEKDFPEIETDFIAAPNSPSSAEMPFLWLIYLTAPVSSTITSKGSLHQSYAVPRVEIPIVQSC